MPLAADMPAPDFALPSTTGGPVELAGLLAAGPAVVMFATADAGVTVVCEAPAAAASRLAARTGFDGRVLAEPAPYETSRAYGLEAVPTTVKIAPSGAVAGTVVGWDAAALSALL